jgi:AraC-like DNA-binding protein
MSRPTSMIATRTVRAAKTFLATADLYGCTIDSFAAHQGVKRTTLAGRLQMAGTSFTALKREERIRRLESFFMPMQGKPNADEAADLLGFAETQSFYLFFKETQCKTFTQWRLERQAI